MARPAEPFVCREVCFRTVEPSETDTQPPPCDDRVVWVDRIDRSQDIESGGDGQSLGSILSQTGPPLPVDRPLWACDSRGLRTKTLDCWYDSLVGFGCDEVSRMSFVCLSQASNLGFAEAKSIAERLEAKSVVERASSGGDDRRIVNVSAFVYSAVKDANKKLRPSGMKYAGMGGYEAGDPHLDNR